MALSSLLLTILAILGTTLGQSIVFPTTAAPSATIVPSASGYTYAGCWNETVHVPGVDGARALSQGNSSANNTMTIASCLSYCTKYSSHAQYAGLEYGRECYCGEYLSAFSKKLDEGERCVFACDGNGSEVCGGSLALTLYNRTSSGGDRLRVGEGGVGWYLVVGVGMVVFGVVL